MLPHPQETSRRSVAVVLELIGFTVDVQLWQEALDGF